MICVLAGGAYYFGVLHGIVPNGEDLATTQVWYLRQKNMLEYRHSNILFDAVGFLSVLAGGMSYFSIRLEFALFYTIVLGLTLYLSLGRGKGRERWCRIPLWAFFMVFIHTVQDTGSFGRVYEETDLIWQLPYHYHIVPLIFALLGIMILEKFLRAGTRKKKRVWGIVGIVTVGYSLLYTDLIYYVVFVAPVLIVLMIRGLHSDTSRSYVMAGLAAGLGIMLVTRVLPVDLCEMLWGKAEVGAYNSSIYGAASWMNLDSIAVHLFNYIKTILILFNIEVSNRPMLSFYSVLFIARIAFVVMAYIIVAKIIAASVRGKIKRKGYTVTDEVLAWSFVVLSCVFIFSKHALYKSLMRYYAAFVPILTVLLCRNIAGQFRDFLPMLESMRNKSLYFMGMMGILCICQAEPVWMFEAHDSYQEDCEAAIAYIRQVEPDYVIAPYWLYARLTAMTEGEIIFFPNERTVKDICGEDAEVTCIVVGWDELGLCTFGLNDIAYTGYEEMCEKYKTPTRVLETDSLFVCIFDEP